MRIDYGNYSVFFSYFFQKKHIIYFLFQHRCGDPVPIKLSGRGKREIDTELDLLMWGNQSRMILGRSAPVHFVLIVQSHVID